ncbi:MAG: GNAT family N-acetyltransferase [Anaerolineae bacterium]|nr:MAG: GNAT family N-acetyltransferase [Anaerolineae bacterium]
MATISSRWSDSSAAHIRPFDPRRDLLAVADLIETCFAETLSMDGRRYIERMRRAARAGVAQRWQAFSSGYPLGGLVWVQHGRVVGNLSLIPFWHRGRMLYLIANVAVHPDFRRRGIARALTQAGLDRARRRLAREVWLHVRDDNPAAYALYHSLGFVPQTRRTYWVLPHLQAVAGDPLPGVRVVTPRAAAWRQQAAWLDANYPPAIRWNFPLRMGALRPDWWGMLYRFFMEFPVRQWGVMQNGRLAGVLSWQPSSAYADRLWLAAPPQSEALTLRAVLPVLREQGDLYRPLGLDYPAGRAAETLRSLGFEPEHTLIWMKRRF